MTIRSVGFRLILGLLVCVCAPMVWGQEKAPVSDPAAGAGAPALNEILQQVEKRYAGTGFSARFKQTSTLKEMAITDTASGKIFVKHPGLMRWEYQQPDRQIFITDSKTLWIYRPEDNQVMVGKAPAYFGGGKGASFLADMNQIRENFSIQHEQIDTDQYYVLTLRPKVKKIDLSVIYLSISKDTFEVFEIVTTNSYGDETRIVLSNLVYNRAFVNSFFKFNIPDGTDVLKLDQ
ncbi:outer membrane lipoprotein chaperone LolA [Thermodesulfobacteriota bacterium]